MSDEQPPNKRRFWQLHLSTAVLMMLYSAGFVGLNATPRSDTSHYGNYSILYIEEWYGWPREFVWRQTWPETKMRPAEVGSMICGYSYQRRRWPGCGLAYALWGALPNLFVCMAGLAAVVFVSEHLIRRREGRKP
jgi:hypothetical protein